MSRRADEPVAKLVPDSQPSSSCLDCCPSSFGFAYLSLFVESG
jgi:hypothetical protein